MSHMIKIGTATLRETKTFRNSYETACWYQDIEVQAGEVADIVTDGYWIIIGGMMGIIKDSHFPSGFGGMYYANDRDREDIGKVAKAQGAQLNSYCDIRKSPIYDIELLDGIDWADWEYEWNGETRTTTQFQYKGQIISKDRRDGLNALREAVAEMVA